MDLEEWELLPKNSFKDLDLDLDHDHNKDHQEDMMMDYFLYPQDPLHDTESQVPIAWEPLSDQENNKMILNDQDLDQDSRSILSTDSVPSSPRVSLEKTEFVDMKIDPSEKITSPLPQIDDLLKKKENNDVRNDQSGEKLNLWKIGVNGVGAICSFGVAAVAASVCVFFLGHNNIKICKNKNNQMLRFQIYSDDNKRMKEVVNHATKLNETIFGMKGVPVVRAQVSFGGHYDGL